MINGVGAAVAHTSRDRAEAQASTIHPTAIVARGAVVGVGSRIGAYAVIGADVVLGDRCIVGPHAVIEGRTTIGAGNRFMQFCSIGAGPQEDAWDGEPGRLEIGERNVFRENVTVHAGGKAPTRIGSHNHLMVGVHVAHDCLVGDHVHFANGATLGGRCEVRDFAWIAGHCAVHQRTRVGQYAFVAAGSIVTQDVPPFCLVQGDRARLVSLHAKGLSAAGLLGDEVAALRRVYRTLFMSVGCWADRMAAARCVSEGSEPVEALLAFWEDTERGVISRTRRTRLTAPLAVA
ncbi:MAG TPA: acyl-ACP--UDP-N-acetylglucosamine O-acyltransferase [Caulobacteraceae bacterium]|nr:acyl-ACP--UDP-N-acetylglucosamine O-acyltransferase [Caulobacteraceae bacterium]